MMTKMINIPIKKKPPTDKVTAICCECFLAFGENENAEDGVMCGTCACGGTLIRPEVQVEAGAHYAALHTAIRTINSSNISLGTMH